jgi:hypothetical protein
MALTPEEQARLEAISTENPELVPSSPVDDQAVMANNPQLPEEAYQNSGLLSTLSNFAPDVGELAGGITGAIKGANRGKVLGLPGAVVGGVAGAVTGRAGGDAVDMALTGNVNLEERLTNLAIAGGSAIVGEAVGTALSRGYRALKKRRAAEPLDEAEAQSLTELFEYLQGQGVTITPAQLSGSSFQNTLEKVALSGFGGEKPLADLYAAQGDALLRLFDEEIALIGATGTGARQATGEAFQNSITQAEKELIAWAEPKYKALDSLAGNQTMSIQGTQQWARNTLTAAKSGRREGAGLRIDPARQKVLEDAILGNNQNLSFADTFNTIKVLSDDLAVLKKKADKNPGLEKFYVEAIGRLHRDAAKGAKAAGSEVYDEYKKVNTIYREGMRGLRPQALKSLATKAPEAVGETIYRTGNVTDVEAAYSAIDKAVEVAKLTGGAVPDAAKLKGDLQAGYLDTLLSGVRTVSEGGEATAALKLLDNIQGTPQTADTFNAVLPKESQARIKQMLGWAAQLEKNSGGNFSLVVRGRQSAELRKLAQTGTGTSAGVALGFFNPALGVGLGLLAVLGPPILARRAVKGKVSANTLKELQGIQQRYVADELDPIRDMSALFSVMISMGITNEDLPDEFKVEGLEAEEALRYQQLQLENPRLF